MGRRDTPFTWFPLGHVVATPGALAALDEAGISGLDLLSRHACNDWGELGPEDCQSNADALIHGHRLLSAYQIGVYRFWIITEADRSATTILLPEEY